MMKSYSWDKMITMGMKKSQLRDKKSLLWYKMLNLLHKKWKLWDKSVNYRSHNYEVKGQIYHIRS